ncbi:hypothetical protein RH831_02360 [Halodesulfurarchaeum sp. HSR-GB]|nr:MULTISPECIES: hypothetical protein [Halodesulfurarchaeum]MDR5656022.1 hypothetical protein [Halodesulfurarchaeum sp. HSR-GB]
MQHTTEFHQIRECPNCNSYWRRTGRHAVGLVDYKQDDTCPTCQAS